MTEQNSNVQTTPKKALSLWQPFASLVVMGIKCLDSRSYPIPKGYEGEVFIHASAAIKKKEVYEDYYVANPAFRLIVNLLFFYNDRTPGNFILPWANFRAGFTTGQIIGKATLGKSSESWALKQAWENDGRLADWEREEALGDHGSNRYAWPVLDPIEFKKGIPAKGTIAPILWDPSEQLNGHDQCPIFFTKGASNHFNESVRSKVTNLIKTI